MTRLVILAPNWLGDAVMSMPAIADVRRSLPEATIAIAARPNIAPFFAMVPWIEDVVTIPRGGYREAAALLSPRGFTAALLLPNSLWSALVAWRAGIPERWGFRGDWRGRLLTKAIDPPCHVHQIESYRRLVRAVGFPNGSAEPRLPIPDNALVAARNLLAKRGWDPGRPLVTIAPGAAFGGAKRWPPERFAALSTALSVDGTQIAMVGGAGDRMTADAVLAATAGNGSVLDLVGTDLSTLVGLLATSRAIVTNDSGAMHLAVAVGTPITALFGPTDERATRPIGDAHAVITGSAWCRPCMLRECPLDHRCMRSIAVEDVLRTFRRSEARG